MDSASFQKQLPVAQALGIETFIFDDGWQARSGDWCPDSDSPDAACQEPRRGDPMFVARFPTRNSRRCRHCCGRPACIWACGCRRCISIRTRSRLQDHPEWACYPISAALVAANEQDPAGGSNEARHRPMNPEALSLRRRQVRRLS